MQLLGKFFYWESLGMKILGKKILDAFKTANGGVWMDTAYQILIVDDIKENIDVLNGILKDEYKFESSYKRCNSPKNSWEV